MTCGCWIFHSTDTCIEIKRVSIIERRDDGWHIDCIATFMLDDNNNAQILTLERPGCQSMDLIVIVELPGGVCLELTKA